jgi:hypothetical protein
MQDASLRLTQSFPEPNAGDAAVTEQDLNAVPHLAGLRVVALNKSIVQANLTHAQYARLTMDAQGKLLKLTVSR